MTLKKRTSPFVPDIVGDSLGGNHISDNIKIVDHWAGTTTFHNMAEPASTDPFDYENICGKFAERKRKENAEILKCNLDRTSGR